MADRQMKSGERVTNHGEVFTAEHEVNARMDLVTGNEKDCQPLSGYKTPGFGEL